VEAAEFARAQKKGAGDSPAPRAKTAAPVIPPPGDDKVPLKVNIFDFARTATTALNPMFPYFAPGCIVPCIALQDPGHRGEMGYFVHMNTVQEVNLCFGSSGSYRVPGGVSVGPMQHPVGEKLDQPKNPDMFYIGVITQRQAVGVPQREAMIFHCDKCGKELFRRDYEAHEMPVPLDAEHAWGIRPRGCRTPRSRNSGMFEIATGKAAGEPCVMPLVTYPVTVDGDQISVGLSD
jgi:hypothetical protein